MKNFTLLLLLFICSCSHFTESTELPVYPEYLADVETELPVINITVDQREFDAMYNNVESEIEIEGRFNLYRDQVLSIENEKVEIEIKGGYSTRFALKTLGIKFEDKYDNSDRSLINPPKVLAHHSINKIKAIRLRNSGSDFLNTMIKDRSFTDLAIHAELDLDFAYAEPALVYVNEVFYGLLNIRTEANTHGMAGLHGVKKDDVTLAKITTHELIKKDGDFERIDAFVAAIERQDLDYLKNEIDLSNFIDYMIFESYLGNTDWPHNNSRFYAINDGKFRFVLFDLDKVAWLKIETDPLTIIEDSGKPNILSDLFFILYEDIIFKQAFHDRYRSLLDSGLISYDAFQPIVQSNAAQIRSEMALQIEKYQTPGTMVEWNIYLDKLMLLFQERELVVKAAME